MNGFFSRRGAVPVREFHMATPHLSHPWRRDPQLAMHVYVQYRETTYDVVIPVRNKLIEDVRRGSGDARAEKAFQKLSNAYVDLALQHIMRKIHPGESEACSICGCSCCNFVCRVSVYEGGESDEIAFVDSPVVCCETCCDIVERTRDRVFNLTQQTACAHLS